MDYGIASEGPEEGSFKPQGRSITVLENPSQPTSSRNQESTRVTYVRACRFIRYSTSYWEQLCQVFASTSAHNLKR
eukprot:8083954-Ditylum_brightwellii.AAC.1